MALAERARGRDCRVRLAAGLHRDGHRHRQADRRTSAGGSRTTAWTCPSPTSRSMPRAGRSWRAPPCTRSPRAAGCPSSSRGTGLYYRALTAGLFEAPPPDPALRARHRGSGRARGERAAARRGCWHVDPDRRPPGSARATSCGSAARWRSTSRPDRPSAPSAARREAPRDLAPMALLLDPPLDVLRARIDARVARPCWRPDFWTRCGRLRAAGYGAGLKPMLALGYEQLGAVLDGTTTLAGRHRRDRAGDPAYARRQRTWFKKEAAAARFSDRPVGRDRAGLARAHRRPAAGTRRRTAERRRLRLLRDSRRHGSAADFVLPATRRRSPSWTPGRVFKGHVLVVPPAHVPTLTDLPGPAVGPFFTAVQRLARGVEVRARAPTERSSP